MIDEPTPKPPSKPLYDFGPNSRDVTAEHAGTIFGLVGAEAARAKPTKPADDPAA
jgi:hypothetical protein